ncbi:hypothetical protein D3C78_1624480 [compost metagenome]
MAAQECQLVAYIAVAIHPVAVQLRLQLRHHFDAVPDERIPDTGRANAEFFGNAADRPPFGDNAPGDEALSFCRHGKALPGGNAKLWGIGDGSGLGWNGDAAEALAGDDELAGGAAVGGAAHAASFR